MQSDKQQEEGQALRAYAEQLWKAAGGSPDTFEDAWPELAQDLHQALQDTDRDRAARQASAYMPRF